jgi:hypothetical protein
MIDGRKEPVLGRFLSDKPDHCWATARHIGTRHHRLAQQRNFVHEEPEGVGARHCDLGDCLVVSEQGEF